MPIGWCLVAVVQPTSGLKVGASWDIVVEPCDPLPNDEAYDVAQQHESYDKRVRTHRLTLPAPTARCAPTETGFNLRVALPSSHNLKVS